MPHESDESRFRGVVSMDGPSGTGKSTVARRLAVQLHARYLDTGAMYRAATVAVLRAGAELEDASAVTSVVEAAKIEISTDPADAWVLLDSEPVEAQIRTAETTAAVSAVSAIAAVRTLLVAAQRDLIADGGIVVEGRDIGSVVWPGASPKVFLTASPHARAERRAGELGVDVETVAGDIARRDRLDSSRAISPLVQAADAVVLDTTELGIDEVVARLVTLAAASRDREGSSMTDDPEVQTAEDDADPLVTPVVAVVGRPNVGKSTLVNRILGRREAVVQDIPGVTRDRVAYDALWNGRRFTLVDTGGWEPDARGLQAMVSAQAERAVATADLVMFVVDGRTGATETDLDVARTLRRARRPVVLAVTKVDDERLEPDTAELWSLGLGEPFPVSGLHGRGSGDLLDAVLERLPDAPRDTDAEDGPRRVALVGRPNVGKSSLLNKLSGEDRAVVDSVAGTTIDPVDSLLQLGGETWHFVDTAGLRRRVHQASGMEYYASLRTAAAIESAEVAVVLLDASERLSEQDQRVIGEVVEAGRALVLAFNKWDLVDEDRREQLTKEIGRDLARVAWAPRVNVSARTGRSVEKLSGALHTSLASWDRRVSTGRLNTWLTEVVAQTPPPPRGGKAPRVLFATQADTRPPRFVLFTTGFLEAGYRRFIERRLREDFAFEGTPIEISVRVREKRKR